MKRPLEDLRILELTQVIAGPFAGMILGDLGAEIIKVESPDGGDSSRSAPPYFVHGDSVYFQSFNRNKKSITLDLKKEKGKEIFRELVRKSDAVIDNLRAGALEKLTLDYENLKKINPRIICCSITGYGVKSPFRDLPAFDLMLQARGGGMSLTGEPGGVPLRMGISIVDHTAAMLAATGILAAVHHREKTGQGQMVDVPLLNTMVSLLTYNAGYYLHSGKVPEPAGTSHASFVPYAAFQTQTRWIVVDAHLPKFWDSLCRVIDREGLACDPRFLNNEARLQNRGEIMGMLEEIFLTRPAEEWLPALEKNGVPCAPINTLDQVFSDPAVLDQKMLIETEHPLGGKLRLAGNPIKMSENLGENFAPPPMLGQHTGEILKAILEFSEEKIQELRKGKVI
jgi:crotonobetainyl-CoA:carnitine CoA-transferase CaiB-like acyl-CoA transferase